MDRQRSSSKQWESTFNFAAHTNTANHSSNCRLVMLTDGLNSNWHALERTFIVREVVLRLKLDAVIEANLRRKAALLQRMGLDDQTQQYW